MSLKFSASSMHSGRVGNVSADRAIVYPWSFTTRQVHSDFVLLEITKLMHMFNSPSEAQEYERKVRQNVDSLLSALEGGNYTNAIAVLDWMKLAVAEKSCVANANESVTSNSPSFPLKVISLKE